MSQHIQKTLTSLFRQVGQSLDRFGRTFEVHPHIDLLQPSTRNLSFRGLKPELKCSFIAPNATVVGNVKIGEHTSVWYNAVIRGDVNPIVIGDNVAISEKAMIHCSGGKLNTTTQIGSRVLIGVGATIHGATLEDECYIGDKATILDGAVVKKHSIVAAGSVVSPKTVIPSGQLWSGIPARYERDLTSEEITKIAIDLSESTDLSFVHAKEQQKGWEQIVQEADDLEENLNRNPHYYQITPREQKPMYDEHVEGYTIPGRIFDSNLTPKGVEVRGGFFKSFEEDRAQVLKNFGIDDNEKKK